MSSDVKRGKTSSMSEVGMRMVDFNYQRRLCSEGDSVDVEPGLVRHANEAGRSLRTKDPEVALPKRRRGAKGHGNGMAPDKHKRRRLGR